MKVLLDLNILVDVFEQREPHYAASAKILSLGIEKTIELLIPGHAPATIHYLTARTIGRAMADEALDWMLASFELAPATREVYLRARALHFRDFEDGVVAAVAEAEHCDYIVTRNLRDFAESPVKAVSPAELLAYFTGDSAE